jgi:hypothetical protein
LDCEYNQISELPELPIYLRDLNARNNPIVKIINLPNPHLFSNTEIFVDNLNLNSAEIYKQFLNDTIDACQEKIQNSNQTLTMLAERIDSLNQKLLGKNREFKSANVGTVPKGPVSMIGEYASLFKGGKSKRKKTKKTKKTKKRN